MEHQDAIEQVCGLFSDAFEEFEPYVMQWGASKPSLKKTLDKLLSLDTTGEYPKSYGGKSAGAFLLGRVLTDPKILAGLFRENEAVLSSSTCRVVRYWIDHPAFWCFFQLQTEINYNLFRIQDLLTDQTHLLHSLGIKDMQKRPESQNKHYLCLMLPNGQCLQTAGILHFNALTASDMKFYCSILDREAFQNSGMSAVINSTFVDFFSIYTISTIPIIMRKGYPVQFIWKQCALKEFAVEMLPGQWRQNSKGTLVEYVFEKADDAMRATPELQTLLQTIPTSFLSIMVDRSQGAVALTCQTQLEYDALSFMIGSRYVQVAHEIEQPDVQISFPLFSVLRKLGRTLPWDAFKPLLEAGPKEPQEDKISDINKALQRIVECRNNGSAYDLQSIAHETGTNLETLRSIEKAFVDKISSMQASYTVKDADRQYELPAWPVPPPSKRSRYAAGLEESGLFEINDSFRLMEEFDTLTAGSYSDEIKDLGLIGMIEEAFLDGFGYNLGYTVMNSMLVLLSHFGHEWRAVKSYAIEIIKLFPYPVNTMFPSNEDFFRTFSRFVRKQICPRGICMLQAIPSRDEVQNGTYHIKATATFGKFLSTSKKG